MAVYEYYCQNCENVVEITHPFDYDGQIICESCKQPRRKKFGVAATIFRGGGWGKNA